MKLYLRGSLGDEVALTGLVREVRRQRSRESIFVDVSRPELFHLNPHVGARMEDSGLVHHLTWASDHTVGNFVHQYAKQLGLRAILDTTPEIFLDDDDDGPASWMVGRKSVAIDTWAGWPRRRWPFERWQELSDELAKRGISVVEVGASTPDCYGSKRDRLLERTDRCVVDKWSIRQTAAILSRCRLFIGADSGLVHLAAAVGTPQIAIYAVPWYARAYRSTYPLFNLQQVMCGCQELCSHGERMIDVVTVGDVLEAMERFNL